MNWVSGLLLLVNVCLLVTGQTLWKIGIGRHGAVHGVADLLMAMFSPWIIGGILLYVVATVISVYLLSKLPLSLVYPLQALTYVVAVIVAIAVFREHVSLMRWMGVLIILVGVGFVVK
ncbi:membrane protein [Alicyclobacillus contaminans]|uniref:EamA family transporter n=1 Tax=Alicyclobacillus contaminans TaxID=392016 RepID=UPI000425C051|nr:EamA family transporter [Alicyclobacillus contaminans]GMA52140.1 membrane protein [Alicyclobacillus contaminans]